jgi:hypothetical protein
MIIGYPYLARLPISFEGDAEALCVYLKSLHVKHLAFFLYDSHVDRMELYANLKHIAPSYDIVIYPFEFGLYPNNETWQLEDAIDNLRASGINYIFGYLHDREMPGYTAMNRIVLDRLIDEGLLGTPDYFWIFQESLHFQFDESNPWQFLPMDEKLATAMNHTIMLTVQGMINTAKFSPLDESVMELVHDPDFWPYFESIRQVRDMNQTRTMPFSFDLQDFTIFTTWLYDAVMSIGLAACQTSNETMFTGPELYEHIMKLDFTGASGTVNFDSTGLRDPRAVEYYLANVISYNATAEHLEQNTTFNNTDDGGDFAARIVNKISILPSTGRVEIQEELVLPGGSTKPPSPYFLPVDLVPLGINAFCWALAGLVLLLSLVFGIWTIRNRKHPKVRASQPIFLVLLCGGTFVIGISTVLVPFQEDVVFSESALSAICMLNMWLLSLGTYHMEIVALELSSHPMLPFFDI